MTTGRNLTNRHIPWFRRIEGRVAFTVALVAAATVGVTVLLASYLLARYAAEEDQARNLTAQQAFRRLVLDRASDTAARLRLVASLPVFRAYMTSPETREDYATLSAMVAEYRVSLNADFCLVSNVKGKWVGRAGLEADAPMARLRAIRDAALDGSAWRELVGIEEREGAGLYLVVAQPAVFGEESEVVGALLAGFRLDDATATSLAAVTGADVSFVIGNRLTASSMSDDEERQVQALLLRNQLRPGDKGRRVVLGGSPRLLSLSRMDEASLPARSVGLMILVDHGPGERLRRDMILALTSVGVWIFGLSLLWASIYARRLSHPLLELASAAEEIARGSQERRVEPSGTVEIQILARSFNEMTSHLREANRELQRQSEKLAEALAQSEAAFEQYRTTEQALRESEDRLRQAQKMDAIGRLAGGVAHDFNNVLTVINGYAELLLHRLPPGDPSRPRIEEIQRAGQRAARLTAQLLAFGRKAPEAPRTLDLNDQINRSVEFLKRLIGEDVELEVKTDGGPLFVRADPGQLEQVVMNLALNARDAMPRGGKLTLSCAAARRPSELPDSSPEQFARLTVRDTGIGMDEETQRKVFEPFFTTKTPGQGTGLGLATVYAIVQQNGGHIQVQSRPGEGSRFDVYLPLAPVAARLRARVGTRSHPRPAEAPAGETILVVEDEEAVRELVREVLVSQGYRVLLAARPSEALEIVETDGAALDLLLTDVVMPELSGRELCERIREKRPDLRVLYMSGYTDDAVLRSGIQDTKILEKPFSTESLARRVRAVLEGADNHA